MLKINRDSLPYFTFCLFRMFRIRRHSAWVRLLAMWWGVSLGKRVSFDGVPIIRRHPGSCINISNGSSFNSLPDSHQGGISRPCVLWTISDQASIEIGEDCGFSGTVISAEKEIRLGANVRCGTNTRIMDSDMHANDKRGGSSKPVVIGDNVWLGANVMVMKGVTIGEGTFVGAGSLVTKSLPAHVVAAGIPAHVIRSLE